MDFCRTFGKVNNIHTAQIELKLGVVSDTMFEEGMRLPITPKKILSVKFGSGTGLFFSIWSRQVYIIKGRIIIEFANN